MNDSSFPVSGSAPSSLRGVPDPLSSAVPSSFVPLPDLGDNRPDRAVLEAEFDRLESKIADLRARLLVTDPVFLRRSFALALAPEEDLQPPEL